MSIRLLKNMDPNRPKKHQGIRISWRSFLLTRKKKGVSKPQFVRPPSISFISLGTFFCLTKTLRRTEEPRWVWVGHSKKQLCRPLAEYHMLRGVQRALSTTDMTDVMEVWWWSIDVVINYKLRFTHGMCALDHGSHAGTLQYSKHRKFAQNNLTATLHPSRQ